MAALEDGEIQVTFRDYQSYHMSMSYASISPSEISLVCEKCGYVLNGLQPEGNCPECGLPIVESSPDLRQPPPWEEPGRAGFQAFIRTSLIVIFHPTRFFRGLPSRANQWAGNSFGVIHYAIASLLFGIAATAHESSMLLLGRSGSWVHLLGESVVFGAGTFILVILLTGLASRLTNWEATYRGLRLPVQVVRRGLAYHSAHYVPVAIVVCMTTVAYAFLLTHRMIGPTRDTFYVIVLCGEIVLGAGYLFSTYWIAMRNLMYANR